MRRRSRSLQRLAARLISHSYLPNGLLLEGFVRISFVHVSVNPLSISGTLRLHSMGCHFNGDFIATEAAVTIGCAHACVFLAKLGTA